MVDKRLFLEGVCRSLIGQTLRQVYYDSDVDGFISTRALGEKMFDYVPLSKLVLVTSSQRSYRFFDSINFLKNVNYSTLDFEESQLQSDPDSIMNQSSHPFWNQYIGSKIVHAKIEWRRIKIKHAFRINPDIYPHNLLIELENSRSITIVAADIQLTTEHDVEKYKFTFPDNALLVFFSRQAFIDFFPDVPSSEP